MMLGKIVAAASPCRISSAGIKMLTAHLCDIVVIGSRRPANPFRGGPSDANSSQGTPLDGQNKENTGVFEMNKIALTAAAILVATSAAFAGSDHYGSNDANQPVANQSVAGRSSANIDNSYTGSILNSDRTQGDANANVPAQSGQGIWGR
jgi:hypothetical protein